MRNFRTAWALVLSHAMNANGYVALRGVISFHIVMQCLYTVCTCTCGWLSVIDRIKYWHLRSISRRFHLEIPFCFVNLTKHIKPSAYHWLVRVTTQVIFWCESWKYSDYRYTRVSSLKILYWKCRSRDSVVIIVIRLRARLSEIRKLAGGKFNFFSKIFKPPVAPSRPPMQLVQVALSPG